MQVQETIDQSIQDSNGPVPETGSDICSNCGAEQVGPFCHQCGQRYTSHILPLKQFLKEIPDALFNLDNRFFATLKQLLFKPGRLTLIYLAGQRVRYLPPFRLYLLLSVLYFFVAAFTGTTSFLFIEFNWGDQTAEFARLLPKIMFVIVPLFALLVKFLFNKPSRLYIEHLIFALHLHALWYFLFLFDALLYPVSRPAAEAETFPWVMLPVVLIHMAVKIAVLVTLFVSLRTMYGQSRMKTFWKMMVLLIGYMSMLGLVVYAYMKFTGLLWW